MVLYKQKTVSIKAKLRHYNTAIESECSECLYAAECLYAENLYAAKCLVINKREIEGLEKRKEND